MELSPNRSVSPLRDRDYGVGHFVEFPSASRNQRYRQFLCQMLGSKSCCFPKLTSLSSVAVIFSVWEWTCRSQFHPAQVRFASLSSLIEAACLLLLTQLTQQEQLTTVRAIIPSTLQSQAITSIRGQIFCNWRSQHHTVLQGEDDDDPTTPVKMNSSAILFQSRWLLVGGSKSNLKGKKIGVSCKPEFSYHGTAGLVIVTAWLYQFLLFQYDQCNCKITCTTQILCIE